VVPPVPWRRLGVAGLVAGALLGALAAYAIPRIEGSKERAEEREEEEAARRLANRRRRLIAEQRAMRGRARTPAGRLSPAAERRARAGLLRTVERAITADARRRIQAGELEGAALSTQCVPSPSSVERIGAERDLTRDVDAYDCLAVSREIPATGLNPAGALGHPFRAVVDFRRFTFAWCKTNPVPGERAVPEPGEVPPLPRACRGP
jgi:hypothetical protein